MENASMINIDIKKPLHGSSGDMMLDITLDIQEGEFLVMTGESGSGKTTLLRILAGLESADGNIKISETVWNSFVPPQKREIGFVFQDYALFPNMTVEQNLLYVTKDRELADHLLDITELTELRDRYPSRLSGGQQQRVGVCRALMNRPKLLLMDEPFSALDIVMRYNLQNSITKLHKEFGTTTIMVSHDANEINKLADRVVVLKQGKVIESGDPKKVLRSLYSN
jgi:molybdate transport system ATP-binding protein